MFAVHGAQDLVRTRLHRQMQIGHNGSQIAVSIDQILTHVVRVRGGVAQAVDTLNTSQSVHQFRQGRFRASSIEAVVSIDVLTQQGQFAHAFGGQGLRFIEDRLDRARPFGAAGIGHHAEGAELVATFLHGEKGGRTIYGAIPRI